MPPAAIAVLQGTIFVTPAEPPFGPVFEIQTAWADVLPTQVASPLLFILKLSVGRFLNVFDSGMRID
jgi:hypothetical protein